MNHSDSIAKLAFAMSKMQAELEPAKEDSFNPFYRSKYADLGTIIDTARPVLAKYGLSVIQFPVSDEYGIGMETILLHESGEWMGNSATISLDDKVNSLDDSDGDKVDKKGKAPKSNKAQEAGGVFTYFRRYGYSAAIGLYTETDTDGNSGQQSNASRNSNNNTRPSGGQNTQQPQRTATATNTQPTQNNKPAAPAMTNTDKTAQEEQKQKENYSRQHPPLSPVQRNKLQELWSILNGGGTDEQVAQGLDKLFVESFKHGLEDATYEDGARLTGELLSKLRSKTDSTGTAESTNVVASPPTPPVPSPIKAPTIKNVAEWKKIVDWAVEQKYIANEKAQMELFKITDKAKIQVIDDSNIKQVKQLIYDAVMKKV